MERAGAGTGAALMRRYRAPATISFLLRIILPRSEHARVIGDLEEEYLVSEIPRRGRFGAWRWYWREGLSLLPAFRSSRPDIERRSRTASTSLTTSMRTIARG